MSAIAENRSIAYSADCAGHAGNIACQALRSYSIDDDRVAYTIGVRNDTGADARMLAFVPDAPDPRHRTVVQAVIGPYADFSTNVELDLARFGRIPEVHIEISAGDVDFALIVPGSGIRASNGIASAPTERVAAPLALRDTLPPPSRAWSHGADVRAPQARAVSPAYVEWREPPRSPAVVPALVLFVVAMVAVGFAMFRPGVSQLTVPRQAAAGAPISIRYRATGIGGVTYEAVGPDAATVQTGTLPAGAGSFALNLPRLRDERTYLVRVAMNGPLGTALAEDYVRVPAAIIHAVVVTPTVRPQRAPAPPQIRSLALDRATLNGGDTLNVYYDVAASNGNVALIDAASQIAYGRSALSPTGHTSFVLPAVQTPRFLSVVVTAQRGTSTIESRVGVTATPQSSPPPQADAETTGTLPGDGTAVAPIVSAPKTVTSQEPIRVEVRGGVPGLTLLLADSDGSELARREVGNAAGGSIFIAPSVTVPTRIRLEATYPQGAGTEMIVRTIVVVPR